MAQSPNAMQEPSMDELLASIREIIEENTGPSPNRNINRSDTSAPMDSVPRNTMDENHARVNQNPASSDMISRSSGEDEHNSRLNVQQYGDVGRGNSDAPPVHDAMNALAARIGLRNSDNSDNSVETVGAYDDRQNVPPPPVAMVVKTNPNESTQVQSTNSTAVQTRSLDRNSDGSSVNQPAPNGNIVPNVNNRVQARPQNSSDHGTQFQGQALQQRNSQVTNHGLTQPVLPPHQKQKSAIEVPQPREMQQMRPVQQQPVQQQRDIPQPNDGALRNQPIQSNPVSQANLSRPTPPQPRVANADIRSNNVVPQSNIRQNLVAERRVPMQQPNFNVEPHLDEKQDVRLNSQSLSNEQQVPHDLQPNQRPASNGLNNRNVETSQSERHVVENQGQSHNLSAQQDSIENLDKPHNVPFPRSVPQKPHFLSQALKSAFLTVPAKDSAFQTASSLPQAPLRPQSVSTRGTTQTRVEKKATEMIEAEVKREMDNMDKALDADFEKSAENLLRPYIAKWLDEHFSELFEKVLRDEIKRVIQSQLR